MSADAHNEFAREFVAIMSAPNGARRSRTNVPGLPVTAGQMADTAPELLDSGVSILHLHVRDADEKHTLDPDAYRESIERVRQVVGDRLLIQVTTEAVGIYNRHQQMDVVRELRPEAVSLALRELCPDEAAETEAAEFFAWLVHENIWPQYILYDEADVARFDRLRRKGLFADDAPFAMLVLGAYADGRAGTIEELTGQLAAADTSSFPWAMCCFGSNENAAALAAVEAMGHVRLGFENNVVMADGQPAPGNAALVSQFVDGLSGPRGVASADDIRERWLAR